MTLHDVLFIPTFKHNLLSVIKLSSENYLKFTFYPILCILQDQRTEKVIAVGKMKKNLYVLNTKPFSSEAITLCCNLISSSGVFLNEYSVHSVNMITWHRSLGYVSEAAQKNLPFYNNNKSEIFTDCDVCKFPKQTSLPFPMSNNRSFKVFDLIHVDIWGPYKVETISRARYFLTLVDDFSITTWVYLMRDKGQTFYMIRKFLAVIKNQYGASVKIICIDNGSEFLGMSCQALFDDEGILHKKKSCPYTPPTEWGG